MSDFTVTTTNALGAPVVAEYSLRKVAFCLAGFANGLRHEEGLTLVSITVHAIAGNGPYTMEIKAITGDAPLDDLPLSTPEGSAAAEPAPSFASAGAKPACPACRQSAESGLTRCIECGSEFDQPQDLGIGAGEPLTRRDYLAAHAPAEPQPWFDVQLLDHPGNPMHQPHHGDFGLAWDDACDDVSGPPAKVNEYLDACTSWGHANVGWFADKEQARLVQWPYAWADAVLAAKGEAK